LAALDDEWAWKQSNLTQTRLQVIDRRMEWLEEQTHTEDPSKPRSFAMSASFFAPWPEVPQRDRSADPDHPGERLLERIERQTDILRRQLTTLRQAGWISGLTRE